MHQASAAGVSRPSVMPDADRICDTAPTVPEEPSASLHIEGRNNARASSSSAPAATCAAMKAARVNLPSGK